TRALIDLEDSEIPLPPDAARLLVYTSERGRYARFGGSPARATVRALAVRTSAMLHDRGFAGHATAAFCDPGPTLADALAAAARAGAHRIVVCTLEAGESRAVDAARRDADALELRKAGVTVVHTPPLWSSAGIAAALAARVIEALDGVPGDTDGAVLISEGRPWQWVRTHPTESEHTTYFAQRVRADLIEGGMLADRVRTAWMEWDEPGVTEVVRHLAALGCSRIMLLPVSMPVDTIATLIDLRAAAEQAAVDEGITIGVLPAWGDDPIVATTLCERIVAAAAEFDPPAS
ncbi:MAG: ferrochelatase, partial [Coriobacteriia bacterium]|nr:ferrochelatase [Coriobacteriia bacterium]